MSHPRDFSVNDAWIVFRINEAPVSTDSDGDFNVVCLMDAASCYLLGNEFVPATLAEIPMPNAQSLIDAGKAVANMLPRKILLSSRLQSGQFIALANKLGIEVEEVSDEELSPFISEAREGFREHFGGGQLQ